MEQVGASYSTNDRFYKLSLKACTTVKFKYI